MKPQPTVERLKKYILHLVLSLIVPFGACVILITITGNRESGMSFGLVCSLLLVNVGFAFYFIPGRRLMAFLSGLAVTLVSTSVTFAVLSLELQFAFDFYGFLTALFFYFLASVLAWEIIYHFLSRKN